MKKICILLISILSMFSFTGCTKNNEDALSFKEEYESLNGESNSNGLAHREVDIDENNPFVYITPSEIIEKIENNETFYLYFGSAYCPWCRSVVEMAIKKAKEYGIDTIYYFNIWNGDHNEIFRDTYKLDDNNELQKIIDGTDEYYKILEYFDNVLSDYTLTDSDGNTVYVNEKRIFAPNYIYVKNGKAVKITSGIGDSLENPRGELTEEVLEDEAKQFDEFFLK
jgi:thiol-disulfide isomerase/thioredoxin